MMIGICFYRKLEIEIKGVYVILILGVYCLVFQEFYVYYMVQYLCLIYYVEIIKNLYLDMLYYQILFLVFVVMNGFLWLMNGLKENVQVGFLEL